MKQQQHKGVTGTPEGRSLVRDVRKKRNMQLKYRARAGKISCSHGARCLLIPFVLSLEYKLASDINTKRDR